MTKLAQPLRNYWYALRHGQSLANVAERVVSQPANGCDDYGLSEQGKIQVQQTFALLQCPPEPAAVRQPDAETLIFASDFKRARQTARLAHDLLAARQPLTTAIELRERDFGTFELGSAQAYQRVWDADRQDAGHSQWGVESVAAVASRTASLVRELEQQYAGEVLMLVSHGDPLQILQCVFSGRPLQQHRSLPPLQTAELRLLGQP